MLGSTKKYEKMIIILEGFKPPKSSLETPILTLFNSSPPIFAYCGTTFVTAWFSLCYIVSSVWFGLVICREQRGPPYTPFFKPEIPYN